MKPLRKIIFPAAGHGTRFLPATKASPKEMLTIVNKPLIQYAVEEALDAGLDQVIMVTGRGKRAIEDHFDVSFELESVLRRHGKQEQYEQISQISRMVEIVYVRQKMALGLGHAVRCAEHWIENEPFAVALADELIVHEERSAMQQLRAVYEQTGCSVLGLMEVPQEHVSRYGIVAYEQQSERLFRLIDMVEKPLPEHAPSNYAIVGRYIFTPRLMRLLREATPGAGNEIQLTDSIARLAREEPVYGVPLQGERFDAGTPLGFLLANATLGLRDARFGPELRTHLKRMLCP
ncbi:MAG: UTP--glucose-1-phosphate uridylyltransferase [Zetaproteobacteria bacterium]|nr:MAG: UTP--glucose-1-phosphate uridylyltransferase [Zetaproteobacteria bacterium]